MNELIERLEKLANWLDNHAHEDGFEICHEAITALQSAGWVSVKDRLPEPDEMVLWWVKDSTLPVYMSYDDISGVIEELTHWQRVTPPPHEAQEQEG